MREKIIPHFDRYALHTAKQKDFEIFKRVVHLIGEGKHLNSKDIKEIVALLDKINVSSRKVYDREKLKRLMNV